MSQPRRAYKFKQRTVSWEVQFADVRRIPQGARVFGESSSHWGVKEASAVALPSIGTETGDWSRHRCVLVIRPVFVLPALDLFAIVPFVRVVRSVVCDQVRRVGRE